ncbi:hypothetical protein [Antarctobacter heliothermus]|uniref:Uncharacterized protein n=1 Tax=Antarctobacter heliothermus TaxID=74033 RepID=A0A239INX2_9RHOB|nr:hypothetical protein [Antarctobacter heliothermus]SNS95476.1 hypothetical protein SAMN04488078_104445 [Antarctobacter heliothermus]
MTFKTTMTLAIGLAMLSGAVQADHANPWATAEDTVLSKNHDANQAKSVGTPGEDEMRGAMTRAARGKTGDAQGYGGGTGGGKGGAGKGGGGKGGRP